MKTALYTLSREARLRLASMVFILLSLCACLLMPADHKDLLAPRPRLGYCRRLLPHPLQPLELILWKTAPNRNYTPTTGETGGPFWSSDDVSFCCLGCCGCLLETNSCCKSVPCRTSEETCVQTEALEVYTSCKCAHGRRDPSTPNIASSALNPQQIITAHLCGTRSYDVWNLHLAST